MTLFMCGVLVGFGVAWLFGRVEITLRPHEPTQLERNAELARRERRE